MVLRSGARSIFGEGDRWTPSEGFERWVALALGAHLLGVVSVGAFLASSEMRDLASGMRKMQRDFFEVRLDIGVETPAPAEPPPSSEEPALPAPEAPVSPPPRPIVMKPRAPEQPPEPLNTRAERAVSAAVAAVAEAAKLLTREDDSPDAVAIASGDSDTLTSGMVAGAGKGTTSTWSPHASLDGKAGGSGSGPLQVPAAPDRSSPARVISGFTDNCEFPVEAGFAGKNHAVVVMTVKVRPDGRAVSATVLSDPGYGFGAAARQCALGTRFIPARDRDGKPTAGETRPFNFRFMRP